MRDRLAVLLLGVVVLYEVVQQGEDPEDAQHEEQLREQNLRGMRLICNPDLVANTICTRYYLCRPHQLLHAVPDKCPGIILPVLSVQPG